MEMQKGTTPLSGNLAESKYPFIFEHKNSTSKNLPEYTPPTTQGYALEY